MSHDKYPAEDVDTDIDTAYEEGAAAFYAGRSLRDNPYPPDSTPGEVWADGFYETSTLN